MADLQLEIQAEKVFKMGLPRSRPFESADTRE